MTVHDIFEIVRLVAVIALVVFAATLAMPSGRLPLALRGVLKIMERDGRTASASQVVRPVSAMKRLFAFVVVIIAILLAVL